jgi:hypothetical protein
MVARASTAAAAAFLAADDVTSTESGDPLGRLGNRYAPDCGAVDAIMTLTVAGALI